MLAAYHDSEVDLAMVCFLSLCLQITQQRRRVSIDRPIQVDAYSAPEVAMGPITGEDTTAPFISCDQADVYWGLATANEHTRMHAQTHEPDLSDDNSPAADRTRLVVRFLSPALPYVMMMSSIRGHTAGFRECHPPWRCLSAALPTADPNYNRCLTAT